MHITNLEVTLREIASCVAADLEGEMEEFLRRWVNYDLTRIIGVQLGKLPETEDYMIAYKKGYQDGLKAGRDVINMSLHSIDSQI